VHLTNLEALIAIILGSGGIGRGAWGFAAALLRRAAAIEGFRADVRDGLPLLREAVTALTEIAARHDNTLADHGRRLDDHDHQLATLKETQCPPASRSLPPPVPTHFR
jgi:hypothetical protein